MSFTPPSVGREATHYLVAQQFLTRLPTPDWVDYEPGGLARSARYFPLVGLVVGVLSALIWLIFAPVLPAPLAAGLAIAVLILSTGALHEDGFADCCDGLGGSANREKTLEIMRDSRIGAYGAVGLVMVIGFRWTGLATFDPTEGALALILAPVLARCAIVVVLTFGVYARSEGAAKDIKEGVTKPEMMIALAISAIVAITTAGLVGLLALVIVLIVTALWLAWLTHRLGGYTGDGLGAVEQITQIVTILCLAAAWT